ncbi:MAG TPA: D-2-hydroxyacid dehydrogenase family protein [Candidatus Binatia bacterium]|nr:D-2-hydroxyacid dehydrogenase family protein [Candidatus Binatia bacterium]
MKVAVLDDYQRVAEGLADWERLDAAVAFFHDHLDDEGAVATRLAPFEIISIMRERTPFPRSLFEKLPNLKLLTTSGMRNLAIDVEAANERGVIVCGTESPGNSTMELTWALILALVRRIPPEDRATRAGRWQVTLGEEVHGKTLGIVGLARIGSSVARVGLAFGMKILAWNPSLTKERAAEHGAELASSLDDLMRRADVVSIHVQLNERSRGLIGARQLAMLKPTAYLINTSRGPLVDEAALLTILREKRIAGAAIDVYDREPLPPDHPFLALENTVLTPHLGYVSLQQYQMFYPQMVEDIEAWLRGSPIRVITPARAKAPHY